MTRTKKLRLAGLHSLFYFFILTFSCLFHAGCPGPRARTEDYLRATAVKYSELLDPHSAQFRNIEIKTSASGIGSDILCGEINAKNKFGAYVGWTRFHFAPGSKYRKAEFKVWDKELGTQFVNQLASVYCKNTTEAPEFLPVDFAKPDTY